MTLFDSSNSHKSHLGKNLNDAYQATFKVMQFKSR